MRAALTAAPAPITTSEVERMPAVVAGRARARLRARVGVGRRQLVVYDLTPGIQTIVNPAVDLGTLAPTPQTRAFQDLWGGLSLAVDPRGAGRSPTEPVRPNLLLPTRDQAGRPALKIGVFVVRRTAARRPCWASSSRRSRWSGACPLGAARQGRNRCAWDLSVAGERLKPGKYLLTYRLLARRQGDEHVASSMPFTVKRGPCATGVEAEAMPQPLLDLDLPAVPESATVARKAVAEALRDVAVDRDAVVAMVSEAVANCAVHAYPEAATGRVRVHVEIADERARRRGQRRRGRHRVRRPRARASGSACR